jgi:hypothetical protein
MLQRLRATVIEKAGWSLLVNGYGLELEGLHA